MVGVQPRVSGQLWSPSYGASLDAGAASHVGPVRRVNEDRFLVRPPVFVVADGMGGHLAGDRASQTVVDVFAEIADGVLDATAVRGALDRAAAAVTAIERTGAGHAPGSTVVAVCRVVESGMPYWCTVSMGDSRIYVLSAAGVLTRLTHDHSVVQELIDDGSLDESDARTHPDRNVVTRALGADLDTPADFSLLPLEDGSRLLLCSDGVSAPLDDAEVRDVLTGGRPAVETAELLVAAALRAGGRDNATAVVVDVVAQDRAGDDALDDALDDDTVENLAVAGGPRAAGTADRTR